MKATLALIAAADMDGVFYADLVRTLATAGASDEALTQAHRASLLIAAATGLHAETIFDAALTAAAAR